ncbi:MAG: SAM-dependent methyltransferase [Eubacterium sp.]|nr:SAM-dependent methyltransferase [Eubacterium sp.]
MKLSDRLQALADYIQQGETMADIGTDHGFLPIYLTEQGICPHVILTDISKGSLEKALMDCRDYDACHEFDLRWGDGLTVLSPGEVDAVVIAGMGGLLMAEILEKDPALSASFEKFILQPRTQVGQLRYRLQRQGFQIQEERLVRERARICEVLLVRPSCVNKPVPAYEEVPELYDFPDTLVQMPGPLTAEYLQRALAKQKRNHEHMEMARRIDEEAMRRTVRAIRRLERLIDEVKQREQSQIL